MNEVVNCLTENIPIKSQGKCEQKNIFEILIQAATQRDSIENTTKVLKNVPTSNDIRYHLEKYSDLVAIAKVFGLLTFVAPVAETYTTLALGSAFCSLSPTTPCWDAATIPSLPSCAIAPVQTQLWLSSFLTHTRFTPGFSHSRVIQRVLGWFAGFRLGSFGGFRLYFCGWRQ